MSKEDAPAERYRLICEHWEIPAGTIFEWHEDGFLVEDTADENPIMFDVREIEAPNCFEPVTDEDDDDLIALWNDIDRQETRTRRERPAPVPTPTGEPFP